MGAGEIRLVAHGIQDMFLTEDPQITYFKIIYRRHTNFSVEQMPQYFIHKPDFGKRATCIVSRNGDLLGKGYLVIDTPKIKKFMIDGIEDPITKFAWVRRLGYAMIKFIEIEIGGQLIDKNFGEWMSIWNDLTHRKLEGFDKMIGDIPELYDFTNGKESYRIYVPLEFWFCKNTASALPLVALQYSEVKIHLELNDFEECHIITPTNYIVVEDATVNFEQFEYIEQNIDGEIASGIFTHFDNYNKRLYYKRISRNKFQSINSGIYGENVSNQKLVNDAIFDPINDKYFIRGIKTKNYCMPKIDTNVVTYSYNKLRNISIQNCFLIFNYIFLDDEERNNFVQSKHEYLIEQTNIFDEKTIESSNRSVPIDVNHPTRLFVWIIQYSYLLDKFNNDRFNYTDSYKYLDNKQIGNSIVINETLSFNGQERISNRSYKYFNYIQPYQHMITRPSEGINMYSFAIDPAKYQPSGSSNMSQIDLTQIDLRLNKNVSADNSVKFRGYALSNNILRISDGIAGIVFIN
jgi:hypothetical protein